MFVLMIPVDLGKRKFDNLDYTCMHVYSEVIKVCMHNDSSSKVGRY